jgi:uncharacterized membrane protein
MGFVDESIDILVDAPVAYALWLDYERYPRFMSGVERVEVIGYCRLRWTARLGDHVEEWETQVVDRVEDTRLRWEAADGRETGEVTFEKLDALTTRVHYQLEYDPTLWQVSDPAAASACLHARVRDDLRAFKALAESLEDGGRGSA